ncbi:MAG: HAMP domain-containing histidine kinase, partial [Holophagales bacterium]|nr:HAMP domain-containing histidine kinase [Holophagales bacterium]
MPPEPFAAESPSSESSASAWQGALLAAAWCGLLAAWPWLDGDRSLAMIQAGTALGAILFVWTLRRRLSASGWGFELGPAGVLAAMLLPAVARWPQPHASSTVLLPLLPLVAVPGGSGACLRWGLIGGGLAAASEYLGGGPPGAIGIPAWVTVAATTSIGFAWARGRAAELGERDAERSKARDLERMAEAVRRQRTDFVTNMSHELRAPLSGILGLAELLLAGRLENTQRQKVRWLQDSARGLLGIVDDLLDVGRLRAGTLRLEEREVHLGRSMEQIAGFLAPQAVAKGLVLECRVDP